MYFWGIMERPANVPAEAIFNSVDNEWKQSIKDSKGEECKYWAAITGQYFCHTFQEAGSNVLSFTRFHPDGTYSQKGTLINGVPEGTMYYQKSEHPTTEPALTEPMYEHIFRATTEISNGQAVWWDYFNKADEPVTLTGDDAVKLVELASNFPDNLIPDELMLLLAFENRHGSELYAQGFSLYADGASAIATWSADEDFAKRLMPFASANGTGSIYAIWDDGNGKMPVVVFGDEGGVHIVAKDILQLMQLLISNSYMSVDHSECSFYKEPDDELTVHAASYKQWMKETFDLDEVSNPDEIIQMAQDEFKASFDAWFKKYVN
jgi:hypothetical protein